MYPETTQPQIRSEKKCSPAIRTTERLFRSVTAGWEAMSFLLPAGILAALILLFSCKKEDDIIPALEVTAHITNVSTYGGSDGAIDLVVTGGKPPYFFAWSNGRTEEDPDSLLAGVYIVHITDSSDQSITDTFTVTQPDPDSLTLHLEVQHVTFYGGSNGAITSIVSGGIGPYAYRWSDGAETPDRSGLTAGTYELTVTDLPGSSVTASATVNEPGPNDIIIEAEITHPSVTGASDGTIDLSLSGGFPPYSILWSTGAETEDLTGLAAGEYQLTVTDAGDQTENRTWMLSDSLADYDGNLYSMVRIGDQIWMGENLRTTSTSEGYPVNSYVYNNQETNAEMYGRLYTWNSAMAGSPEPGTKGVCPSGWHVPTDDEFKDLEMYLGMTQEEADMENTWRGAGVGTKLKQGGESGYEAVMAGRRSSSGAYGYIDAFEYVWTSNEYGEYAWRRCLSVSYNTVGRWNTFPKTYAFSVRCIKDDE